MPYPFSGQLNQNEIFNALFNMIISIQTEAGNIKGTYGGLAELAKVDGGLYGDTKIYVDTDVLETHPWGNDAEARNLLELDRPANPSTQYIVLNVFRQIRCTIDNYLSKRAFFQEGQFAQFNAVLLGWLYDTKRVYDSRIYNTFIGNTKSTNTKENLELDLATLVGTATGEEKNRLRGQYIAEAIANLLVDMRDTTRDYNDYEYMRSFDLSEIRVIWNAKYLNEITKLDLPTIFHKDGLVDKISSDFLPKRYFGNPIVGGDTPSSDLFTVDTTNHTATVKSNNVLRAAREVNSDEEIGTTTGHLFPADLIPTGLVIPLGTDNKFTDDVNGSMYIQDDSVICKIVTELPPFMSAFSVGTKFVNPRSLTENNYLTYGHNTLEYLKGKPFITIVEKASESNSARLFAKKK